MDSTAVLIGFKATGEKDAGGNQVVEEIRTEIFVREEDARSSEFFSAAQLSKKPAYMLKTFHLDYEGQEAIEYRGKRYSIYRTYRPPGKEVCELYLEEKAGR